MCKPSVKIQQQAAPAPAVAAPPEEVNQSTDVDSTGENLKRKSRGKQGLTIANNFSGNGGTGLNV